VAVEVFSRQRTCLQGLWPEQSPCCDHGLRPPRLLTRRSAVLTRAQSLPHSNNQTTNNKLHPPTHPCNGPLSRTNRVSRYQKSKTNLDFTEARDSEWQWNQLGHMQVCTLHHANTSPLSFLQAGRPSCCPTNSIKSTESIKLVLHPIRHKICHFRDILPRKSLGWVPLKPVQLLFKQHKTE